ncbi:VOC family protein [Candidatus Enterococcus ikei]|uniref:VOC family protein n=1 Tax=Candidatus Enterococcus ikei TaxID=2815326 RepID=A0ABS3GW30_9ENTE|nr:VOC family protein [Enterococcus sp. DIV0869a]MBO0439390.1 VOC family protein [Enterococcus sp. DIV0869a]
MTIMLEVYLNFKNQSADAIAFYETVFDVKSEGIMTFADAPEDPEHPTPEAWKDLIINASMTIEGVPVMFSDVPDGMGLTLTEGNNISLVISTGDEAKIDRFFARLAEGGKVTMPLGKTFWSKKYGMVIDKFGINWMLNYDAEA